MPQSGRVDTPRREAWWRQLPAAQTIGVGATCVVLVAIAYATRDSSLGGSPVHTDDAWVLLGWKARDWTDVQRAGSSSLGFVLLLRAWLEIVGFTHRHAEWLPLIASLLCAPAFLLVALRMRIRYSAALLGAVMLLASPTLVSYATRVKQYSFEVLLGILLIGLAAALLREPTAKRAWIAYSICSVISLVVSFALVGVVLAGIGAGVIAVWRENGLDGLRRSTASIYAMAVALFVGSWFLVIIRPTRSTALHDFWSGFYLSEPVGTPPAPPWWHWTDTTHHGLLAHDWKLVQFLFEGAFSGPTTVLIVGFVVASVLVAIQRPLHAFLFGIPVLLAVAGSFAQLSPFGGGRTDVWLYAPMTFMIASAVDILLRRVHDSPRPDAPARRTRSVASKGGALMLRGSTLLIVLVCLFNIPAATAFVWPDVVPLVTTLEASRKRDDLVVVGTAFTFNYALYAPQPFATKVNDRNATHFTPVVQGVNVMNWQDYAAPVAELDRRLRRVRDVWLLDAPNIAYPMGEAPRRELASQGFHLVSQSHSVGGVLEHWRNGP
jgi:hypothetical protein